MGSRAWWVVAIAVMALAAGCGGDPAPTGSAQSGSPTTTWSATVGATTPVKTSGKPCELLTGADAAPLLGLGSAPAPTTSTATECGYEGSNGLDSVELSVEPEVYDAALVDTVFKALNQDKAARVNGLGDAAFTYTFNDLGSQLHVWAKGKYITVTVIIASRRVETVPLARALTETALSRL